MGLDATERYAIDMAAFYAAASATQPADGAAWDKGTVTLSSGRTMRRIY